MNIDYTKSGADYFENATHGAHGYQRADRRFWMAYPRSVAMPEQCCLFGIMDDFGNMVETDGNAYNKNARIGAIFGN